MYIAPIRYVYNFLLYDFVRISRIILYIEILISIFSVNANLEFKFTD